jgi:hypothetical protein
MATRKENSFEIGESTVDYAFPDKEMNPQDPGSVYQSWTPEHRKVLESKLLRKIDKVSFLIDMLWQEIQCSNNLLMPLGCVANYASACHYVHHELHGPNICYAGKAIWHPRRPWNHGPAVATWNIYSQRPIHP